MKTPNVDVARLILRITIGGLLLFHGIKKLIDGHDFIRMVLAEKGLPEFLWVGVPIAEVLAPLLIIFGIFTRSSAALIAFTMVMTIYLAYGGAGFELNQYGAFKVELNLFFFMTSVVLFFLGSGKFSLSETVFGSRLSLKNL